MLAKIWKKLFLVICIIAIIINIGHKMINRTSLKDQLIELATTESLSTSIKHFVQEKFGNKDEEDKKEFSDPVGEVVDVFKKDKATSNKISENTVNTVDENSVKDVDAMGTDENQNTEESSNKSGGSFTRIIQNMVDDMNDNAYLNDDPSDDLIYSGDPTF